MERIKANKGKILFSCIIILIPMIAGILLWDKLPDSMATHFGTKGEANGYSSKFTTIFGIPIILMILQLIASCTIALDTKKGVPDKIYDIVLYIIPAISLVVMTVIYSGALGGEINALPGVFAILGIVFIMLGNYMPKVRQNKLFGVKLAPTFESRKNWEASNRFAGWMMCLIGLIILIIAFVSMTVRSDIIVFVLIGVVTVGITVTIIYPYIYKSKHSTEEDYFD